MVLPFFMVYFIQAIFYDVPIHFAFTFAARILIIYLTVKIIGKDFIKIFINSIKFIAIISLGFYALQNINVIHGIMIGISENFTNINSDPTIVEKPNFIIYAIQPMDMDRYIFYRNSGPFWEPGLYVVFLNIALFLNMFLEKRIISKTNLIFIINIITAFSTSGFIALILVLFFYVFLSKNLPLGYRIGLVLILTISIPAIASLSFMGEKIESQIDDSDVSYSRFGAAVVHWNIMKDYPITGLPYDEKTYSNYADAISPNGITEIFIRYGIIVGLLFYLLLFVACRVIMKLLGTTNNGFALFFIVVIVLFGETIGTSPIYWAIILSQYTLRNRLLKVIKVKKYQLLHPLSIKLII